MANSVWGKWTQNPSGQQEIKMCGSMCEYHDFLKMGCVKRVSLILDKLLQVELKLDRLMGKIGKDEIADLDLVERM